MTTTITADKASASAQPSAQPRKRAYDDVQMASHLQGWLQEMQMHGEIQFALATIEEIVAEFDTL